MYEPPSILALTSTPTVFILEIWYQNNWHISSETYVESFLQISRVHFELSILNEKMVITNKSMNGTYVNRVLVSGPIPVTSGDLISVLDESFDIFHLWRLCLASWQGRGFVFHFSNMNQQPLGQKKKLSG